MSHEGEAGACGLYSFPTQGCWRRLGRRGVASTHRPGGAGRRRRGPGRPGSCTQWACPASASHQQGPNALLALVSPSVKWGQNHLLQVERLREGLVASDPERDKRVEGRARTEEAMEPQEQPPRCWAV